MIDFGALTTQLISTCWWTLPLLALAALFKSAWFKGLIGEALVNLAARLFLDKNEYHLIKNVTIPTEDGTTRKREVLPFPSDCIAKSVTCSRIRVNKTRQRPCARVYPWRVTCLCRAG